MHGWKMAVCLALALLLCWLPGCGAEQSGADSESTAQAPDTERPRFVVYERDGKYGYRYWDTSIYIEARYDEVTEIEDGIGYVCLDGRWGHVTGNRLKVEPFADQRYELLDGMALVAVDGFYGIIGLNGEYRMEPGELEHIAELESSYAVRIGDTGVIVHETQIVILPDDLEIVRAGPNYYIARNKKRIRYGVVGADGTVLLETVYTKIGEPSSTGMALVEIPDEEKSSRRYVGYIDADGSVAIEPIYTRLGGFYGGYATAVLDGFAGTLDTDGNVVIPFEYDALNYRAQNLLQAKKDGKIGFINDANEIVIPLVYDGATVITTDNGGLFRVSPISKSLFTVDENPKEYIDHGTIWQHQYIDLEQNILYETPVFVFFTDALYLDFRMFLSPDTEGGSFILEGCYAVYDVSGIETQLFDINGYYGYGPGPQGWMRYEGYPLYEAIVWDEWMKDVMEFEFVPYP